MGRREVELEGFTRRLLRLIGTYRWIDDDGRLRAYTAASLARALEDVGHPISASQVSRMVSGQQRSPGAALIGALCDVFEVDPAYWYYDDAEVRGNAATDRAAADVTRRASAGQRRRARGSR